MIPILYDSSETLFTGLGLGALAETISTKVSRVLNGKDELVITYPVTGKRYADIQNSNIIYAVPEYRKDPQPYRIYRISAPLKGIITVYARHASEQKNFIPVRPFMAGSISECLTKLPNYMLGGGLFSFWTNKTTVASFNLTEPAPLGSVLGGMEGSILDVFGGEYEFDHWQVKIWNRRGTDRGVTIRYGKNMKDLVKDESIDNTITGVYPYYFDDETEELVTLPEEVIESETADSFPFRRTVIHDFSFDFEEKPTVAQLRSKATSWMARQNIGVPEFSIKVVFEHLSQYPEYKDFAFLETVNLGDTIHVIHEVLGVNVTARAVETVYDPLNEKYISVNIGSIKSSFTDTVRSIDSKSSSISKETTTYIAAKIQEVASKIITINGGHVVINTDQNDKPYEFLALDTENVYTATNVLRIDEDGISASTTGYAGTYTLVLSLAGALNASTITVGTMAGDRISGGMIQSVDGGVYFDLDNEVVRSFKPVIVEEGQPEPDPEYVEFGNGKIDVYYGTTKIGEIFHQLDQNDASILVIQGADNGVYIGLTDISVSLNAGDSAVNVYDDGLEKKTEVISGSASMTVDGDNELIKLVALGLTINGQAGYTGTVTIDGLSVTLNGGIITSIV